MTRADKGQQPGQAVTITRAGVTRDRAAGR